VGFAKEHEQVVRLSVTDDVSGFHNTRYLRRYFDRFFDSLKTRQRNLSLVFFDIDNFKAVVDKHGHLLGSRVLREVAQAVNRVLDEDDRIVRYGGDEYVVILPGQDKVQALGKVEKIREAIRSTVFLERENLAVHVTASFGVATYPEDATSEEQLLAAADECLFESKRTGKNRITLAVESKG
jgi:diguanylate cyclase (GGDEF)-like protein